MGEVDLWPPGSSRGAPCSRSHKVSPRVLLGFAAGSFQSALRAPDAITRFQRSAHGAHAAIGRCEAVTFLAQERGVTLGGRYRRCDSLQDTYAPARCAPA